MINVILNSMGEGVLLLNQADRIVLMNPSAEKILDMTEKEGLVSTTWRCSGILYLRNFKELENRRHFQRGN